MGIPIGVFWVHSDPLKQIFDPRVLFGDEVLIGSDAPVALRVLCRPPPQIDELLDDFVFARAVDVQARCIAVQLYVLTEDIEAAGTR